MNTSPAPTRHAHDAFCCGDTIRKVVTKLHAEARRTKHAQVYSFNGCDVVVRPNQSIRSALCGWRKAHAKPGRTWHDDAAREFRLDAQFKHESKLDTLMATVPDCTEGWLKWMAEYVDSVQVRGVWRRSKEVTRRLKAMGWTRNGACGLTRNDYDKPEVLVAWIAGQIMAYLRRGYAPHPRLADLALPLRRK